MKKITMYLFIVGSIFATWRCTAPRPKDQPTKLLSLGNLGVESMLHNVSSRSMDSTWLSNIRQLKEMDRMAGKNLESSPQSSNYKIVTMSCCSCGGGCCKACDTLRMMLATPTVLRISMTSESPEKTSVRFESKSVDNVKLFDVNTNVPDGKYLLNIEMLPPQHSFSVPMTVEGRRFTLEDGSGFK
jgi:hypothetical protein